MSTVQIVVTAAGVAIIAFIAWFFWFASRDQTRAAMGVGGVQEVTVTVRGGYTPDIIVVRAGIPVRLHFIRQESSPCSEQVLFPTFSRQARLPEGETVTLELTPDKPGEYDFQCQMGMLRGKLIAE